MYKTFALMLTAAFAVAALTTTTMQTQPAYSQAGATHCSSSGLATETCVTPGETPTQTTGGLSSFPSHQEAGQGIGEVHQGCENKPGSYLGCTVTPPGRPIIIK
jgi:hypothetical protein